MKGMHRFVRAWEAPSALASMLLIVACNSGQAASAQKAHETQAPAHTPPPALPAASNAPSPEPAPSTLPEAAPAAVSIAELVELVLATEVKKATPEQTQARFAKAAHLERSSIVPEVMQLKSDGVSYTLTANYGQDGKGG
jgi:hypothetical protein